MKVKLRQVTRENWKEALTLKVAESQSKFVPSAAISLAKVYIKPDGDQVEYLPFAIYDDEKMVGFIMHAYEDTTTNMYWINGFFIDENYQGKGYGRAALAEMIEWIRNRFKLCQEIRLTVFKENLLAYELYKSFGFLPTGEVWGGEDVLFLTFN